MFGPEEPHQLNVSFDATFHQMNELTVHRGRVGEEGDALASERCHLTFDE